MLGVTAASVEILRPPQPLVNFEPLVAGGGLNQGGSCHGGHCALASSCLNAFFFLNSSSSAGGYWPVQYHEPGASQILLAGSSTQSLDFLEVLSTLKMRTLLYLQRHRPRRQHGSGLTRPQHPSGTAGAANSRHIIGSHHASSPPWWR